MALRNATLVAFDGTHSSGKTTLIYAVSALLRRQGVHVAPLVEPARTSPFVDDVVIHRAGDFDIPLELDLFAAHLTNTLRAIRSYDVVLCDKTPTNVLAYCKMLLSIEPRSWNAQIVGALDVFCRAWGQAYDAVFFCQDHYDVVQPGDRYRARVIDRQAQDDYLVRAEYAQSGRSIIEIPRALDIEERARWVARQMQARGLAEGRSK